METEEKFIQSRITYVDPNETNELRITDLSVSSPP